MGQTPRYPDTLLAALTEYGGAELAERYVAYWEAATEPRYPRGWFVPTEVVVIDDLTRALFEVNLLRDANSRNGGPWMIYRNPGYEGPLSKVRSWDRTDTE